MTSLESKPQIILYRSGSDHYQSVAGFLESRGIAYCELGYLAEISDKNYLNEASLAIAIVEEKKDGIDFLRSVMHFDHLIQRMMLSSKNDLSLFKKAVNTAHINYYLPLPLREEEFSLYLHKAFKRYHDLTRPFQQLQMLSQITRDLFSDKERYKREALNDSLTGLLNRRAFNSLLESFFEKKADSQKAIPFALAMIDLDHFKHINDQYGHVGGDQVLKSFGRQLSNNLRGGLDQAFRYGGEEFAILSFHSSTEDAVNLLERLSELVRISAVDYEGRRISFTFSAGIAHSDQAGSPEQLIELADKQLYRAKSEGRNRICAASAKIRE